MTGATIELDGSASTDADGDALIYTWVLSSQPVGSAATIANANAAKPTFVPDVAGTYVATLVVNDGKVTSAPANVTITTDAVAFDSIPSPLPANVPSYGLEAYSLGSIGDQVTLKPGSAHTLKSFSVVMSSWACETGGWNTKDCVTGANAVFTHPITVSFYDVNHALIATRTQTFSIPYRPSTHPDCVDSNGRPTGAWKTSSGECKNGIARKIEFDLRSLNATLPDTFSYEVSYNTSHHGPAPIGGAGGAYDSLNVGIYDTATSPSVGSDPLPADLVWNGTALPKPVGAGVMAQVRVGAP